MKACINGQERELPGNIMLAELLDQIGVPPAGVAVAKNDRVVRRSALASEPVREGDRIEIIKAVAGG